MNVDISPEGITKMIEKVAPQYERPLNIFVLVVTLVLYGLAPITFVVGIVVGVVIVGGGNESVIDIWTASAWFACFIAFLAGIVVTELRSRRAKRRNKVVDRLESVLEGNDLDVETRRVLEEILGEDKR